MRRVIIAAALALLTATSANAQVRSPQKLKEAEQFFVSCNKYKDDNFEMCKLGQKDFSEDYADAFAGRLVSWRNIAFFFSHNHSYGAYEDPHVEGISLNMLHACAWRMAILLTGSAEIENTDERHLQYDCVNMSSVVLATLLQRAQNISNMIDVVDEDDPKAPWNRNIPPIPCPPKGADNHKDDDPPFIVYGCPK